ncbi:MATE family efflux transporter [Marinicella sp. W31]|uniref:MATE family efflux transporter n=1 Tax=Marinicella sp. W31 TaxID=3023713 RepID=UPI003758248C
MATEKDLTKGSIRSHLIALSIPASMGMLFDTLYNLTDNWFAGKVSDTALVGLSIASVVFLLLIAITIGLQSGTSAVIAPDYSKRDQTAVKQWVNNAFGIGLLMSIVVLITGLLYSPALLDILSDDSAAKTEAWRYLIVIIIGNAAYAITSVCAGTLMAMGNTTSFRNVLVIGFFANWILNPLLTFYFGLGITGLALATLIIKLASAFYLMFVVKRKIGIMPRPSFQWLRWKETLQQVLPASFNFLTIIIGGFIIVAFIGRFGSNAVAGYSVALRIEQMLLMPALGLNAAVMALVGQNYGANLTDRIRQTYRRSLQLGFYVSLICIPLMIFASPYMMGLFTNNQEIIDIGTLYLRADAVAFFAYVIIFTCVAVLQAIKQPNFPMVIGIIRQLILPVAVNYVLIVMLGYPVAALFWSIVMIVIFSALLMLWYTQRQLNRMSV